MGYILISTQLLPHYGLQLLPTFDFKPSYIGWR